MSLFIKLKKKVRKTEGIPGTKTTGLIPHTVKGGVNTVSSPFSSVFKRAKRKGIAKKTIKSFNRRLF